MNEVKQDLRYGKHPKMVQLTKELAETSRNSDRVGFAVTYSATEGNLEIHERFQKFCADRANNEYLAGIGKLLDYAEFMAAWLDHEQRIQALEVKSVKSVEHEYVAPKVESNVIKTIGE